MKLHIKQLQTKRLAQIQKVYTEKNTNQVLDFVLQS